MRSSTSCPVATASRSSSERSLVRGALKLRPEARSLADMRARLRNTRWPDELPAGEWERGTSQVELRRVVDAWQRFEWRSREAQLNGKPITGEHYLEIWQPNADGKLSHGWAYANPIEALQQAGGMEKVEKKPASSPSASK